MMPKAFPDGQSSICRRGLWETTLTHSQPFTAAASCSNYEASGIPEMNPVKMVWQGRAQCSAGQECRKDLPQMALSAGSHKIELSSIKRNR